MPRSSHTHLQTATSPHTDQSLRKSVPALPKKKFIFFLPTLRCFNFFAIGQPMTDKHFDSSEHKQKVVQLDTEDRTPSANTGFASGGVTCKLGALCFESSVVLVDSFVLRNPPERKARKRYSQ